MSKLNLEVLEERVAPSGFGDLFTSFSNQQSAFSRVGGNSNNSNSNNNNNGAVALLVAQTVLKPFQDGVNTLQADLSLVTSGFTKVRADLAPGSTATATQIQADITAANKDLGVMIGVTQELHALQQFDFDLTVDIVFASAGQNNQGDLLGGNALLTGMLFADLQIGGLLSTADSLTAQGQAQAVL